MLFKRNARRLMLNKETLRHLQDFELRQVVGGAAFQPHLVTGSGCMVTGSCLPCPSSITDGGTSAWAATEEQVQAAGGVDLGGQVYGGFATG